MEKIVIKKLSDKEKSPWDLLLLADPSKDLVKKYLKSSDVYVALINNTIVGEYVLTNISSQIVELKNIAVDEAYQGKGIGKQLVIDAILKAKNHGAKRIEVGTGNSGFSQLALYQKCGFRIVGVDKDFFIKNYDTEKWNTVY